MKKQGYDTTKTVSTPDFNKGVNKSGSTTGLGYKPKAKEKKVMQDELRNRKLNKDITLNPYSSNLNDYFIPGEVVNLPTEDQTLETLLIMMNEFKLTKEDETDAFGLNSLFTNSIPVKQDLIHAVLKNEIFDPNKLITKANTNVTSG